MEGATRAPECELLAGLRATREALDGAVAAPVWRLSATEVVDAIELVLAAEAVLAAVRGHPAAPSRRPREPGLHGPRRGPARPTT